MNAGQLPDADSPAPAPTPPVGKEILAEWVKVMAVLVGIAVMPVLTGRLAVDRQPVWALPLGAGVLALIVGLVLGRPPQTPRAVLPPATRVGPWRVWVEMAERFSGRPASQSIPAATPAPASAPRATSRLPENEPLQIAPAHLLIALGLLLVLPGLIAFITQSGGFEHPERIAWFFSSPALVVWAAAEALDVHVAWKASQGAARVTGPLPGSRQPAWAIRPGKVSEWAVVVAGLLSIASAAILVLYLALAYSMRFGLDNRPAARLDWSDALALAGAALAVLSAILGSFPQVIQARAWAHEHFVKARLDGLRRATPAAASGVKEGKA